MSVTTVDIDKALLAEAKAVLGSTTTKATIDLALREAVMRRRQRDAVVGIAALDLEIDPGKHVVDDEPGA